MSARSRSSVPSSGQRRLRADGAVSRRTFLKGSGVLVVAFSLAGPARLGAPAAARAQEAGAAQSLDSWLAIAADGSVTLFTGKVDLGTGVETALAQIAAEELNVPFGSMRVVQGDTAVSPDQGRTVGSLSISQGGLQVRKAAAEARQALLRLASDRLGVPADALAVRDGVVSVAGDPSRTVSYGALVGGRRFELEMTGTAEPKRPADYTIVGQPIPRLDIPAKMTGSFEYVQNVRLPGMLHGRVVRPTPQSGATLVGVDQDSVRDLPGVVQVVVKGNLVGVVAEREEQAIEAAKQLRVTWSDPTGLPDQADLFDIVRRTPSEDKTLAASGDVAAALGGAAKLVRATYEFPFQSHAMMGPSCGVADVRADRATVWSGTQHPHGLAKDLATWLDLPEDAVRVIYTEGSGCYGRYTTDDAALDAALLSQAVGRPVRVQWMRHDEHGWDHYNTPMLFDLQAGLDADGKVVAYDWQSWSARHTGQALLGDQTGNWVIPLDPVFVGDDTPKFYDFANTRYVLHAQDRALLRYGNNRSLGAMLSAFAAESFMDELAAAAGADPVEFRLRHLSDQRAIDALRAAVDRAGWDTRPSPRRDASRTGVVAGRGLALGEYGANPQLGHTWIATVAEVEVNQDSGEVQVKRMVVAHDCGLIVNPDGVRNQVEGNTLQSLSRTLFEEVAFDRSGVTSVDWRTYPILTFEDVPEVEVILIDRPDVGAAGAGESATIPTAAAIANAIFDATGVRLRRVPFTVSRVRAALQQRG